MTDEEANGRVAMLLRDRPVMCTGWMYHCICSEHQGVVHGLADRYRNALVLNDQTLADTLRRDITRQQSQLAKRQLA